MSAPYCPQALQPVSPTLQRRYRAEIFPPTYPVMPGPSDLVHAIVEATGAGWDVTVKGDARDAGAAQGAERSVGGHGSETAVEQGPASFRGTVHSSHLV
jgi:hypothetical protein